MTVEGFKTRTVTIPGGMTLKHGYPELVVRALTATQFCVPFVKLENDWLSLKEYEFPAPDASRPIETLTNLNPHFLGDATKAKSVVVSPLDVPIQENPL